MDCFQSRVITRGLILSIERMFFFDDNRPIALSHVTVDLDERSWTDSEVMISMDGWENKKEHSHKGQNKPCMISTGYCSGLLSS